MIYSLLYEIRAAESHKKTILMFNVIHLAKLFSSPLYLRIRVYEAYSHAKLLNWISFECFGNNRDSIVQPFGHVSKTDIRESNYRESIYLSQVIHIHQLQPNVVILKWQKKRHINHNNNSNNNYTNIFVGSN